MRQGNDIGTQYRSSCWSATTSSEDSAEASRARYQEA
jgi:peptide methionine sulfoxide reductase MsrA